VSNVHEILSSLGYSLIDKGREYRCLPLYRESDDPTVLKIKKDTGEWYDFKLCIGGRLESLVAKTLGKDEADAKKYLNQKDFVPKVQHSRPKLQVEKTFPNDWLNRLSGDHSYWRERGISSITMEKFRGGVANRGSFYGRYVFPIFKKNYIAGFAGRDLLNNGNPQRPKWKLIGSKKNWIYPAKVSHQYVKESKQVILVESIGDMLSLHENNVRNVLVLFGLSLPSAILNYLLSVEPKSIVIALNNDESNAGNLAAERVKNKLTKFFSSNRVIINLPVKNDFGEMTGPEIKLWSIKNG
jgi:hypothetical protein